MSRDGTHLTELPDKTMRQETSRNLKILKDLRRQDRCICNLTYRTKLSYWSLKCMIEGCNGGIIVGKFLSILPEREMLDVERWHRLDLTSRQDRETRNITRSPDSQGPQKTPSATLRTPWIWLISYWRSKVSLKVYIGGIVVGKFLTTGI